MRARSVGGDGQVQKDLDGQSIFIASAAPEPALVVGNATACNAVVHIIDRVLIPRQVQTGLAHVGVLDGVNLFP